MSATVRSLPEPSIMPSDGFTDESVIPAMGVLVKGPASSPVLALGASLLMIAAASLTVGLELVIPSE